MSFKNFSLFFFILSVLFITPGLSFCENNGTVTISNLSHNISSKGELLYKIKAKSGTMEDFSSKSLMLDSIEVILIKQGQPDIRIFADRGRLSTTDKNLELDQNIRAFNNQYKITCDKVFFKNDKKMIYLNGRVRIESQTSIFISDRGEFDIEADTLTLISNVKGVLNEI
ncbi:MAG: LPS export ABC transporter periplasmic protein LptC [Desulfobacteraceae bacterium]